MLLIDALPNTGKLRLQAVKLSPHCCRFALHVLPDELSRDLDGVTLVHVAVHEIWHIVADGTTGCRPCRVLPAIHDALSWQWVPHLESSSHAPRD